MFAKDVWEMCDAIGSFRSLLGHESAPYVNGVVRWFFCQFYFLTFVTLASETNAYVMSHWVKLSLCLQHPTPPHEWNKRKRQKTIVCKEKFLLTRACVCEFWLLVLSRLFTVLKPFNNLANVVLFFVSRPSVGWMQRMQKVKEKKEKCLRIRSEMLCGHLNAEL